MKFNYKEAVYRPELCASELYSNIWPHIDEHVEAAKGRGFEIVDFRAPKKGETCLSRNGTIFSPAENYGVEGVGVLGTGVAYFILQKVKVFTDSERLDFLLEYLKNLVTWRTREDVDRLMRAQKGN